MKVSYLIFLDETDEGCPFNLNPGAELVIQRDDKMKKITLTQISRRLLLELSSTQTTTIHIRIHDAE